MCKTHTPPAIYHKEAGQLISRSERWMMSLRGSNLQICACFSVSLLHFHLQHYFGGCRLLQGLSCAKHKNIFGKPISSELFQHNAVWSVVWVRVGWVSCRQHLALLLSKVLGEPRSGRLEKGPVLRSPVFSIKTTFGESYEVWQHWWRLTLADACAGWLI